ncbi:hypothetical protein MUK42_02629 [Musa troglodytarum]|uniref:non-specific serine/threonine protein kinase n=1 Tax=Musa troglodytarum TaxID=320322 RepID=A0A9E7EQV4_9LILI|nr:hypothetical protein MUK42_02629 [Musa troglodytarum]
MLLVAVDRAGEFGDEVSLVPPSRLKITSSTSVGVDRLPDEMSDMKIRDDKEAEATVIDGNGTETGHIIVTTVNGRNGQPKQTVSYMAERIVGHGSFGIVFQAKCLETETVHRVIKHYNKMNQRMPLIYVKLYMYQICRALAYIHGSIGVCHRDIKPQNLLVNPHTHQLKLCDFGSAKVLVKGEPNISYICSRYYRAPELIFGATEYTTAIDIWSAGCVFAELLLGQPLFPGESGVDQLVEIIKVLGTPTREEIKCMNPNYTEFKFPQIKAHPWHKIFHKRMPPEAVDLVSRLLQYSPNLRCTALEALIHPFFDELRDSDTRLPNSHFLPPLFNFKPHELKGVPMEIVAKLIPEHARKQWANANSSNSAVLNVLSFGAVGDGVSDDTDAFKSAWDSACEEGPGVVLVPQGYAFKIRSTIFAGPCHGELTLQVDGTIMPPDGPDAWPQRTSRRQWLVFYRANGLTLQGGGLFDGKGAKWWDLPCKPHKGRNHTTLPGPCDSPVAFRFFMSSNLAVRGIRIHNSPQFHFRFDNCRNVTVDAISINSPALSPNTDGIHVENSVDVGIYNSVISSGDDCVSIGAGSTNIHVRNLTCGPSHGISIGSLGKQNTRACVTNVTVKDSVIKHSDNGVRIKTWQGGSGSVSWVSFENIRMDTVRNPIIINQYYCLTKVCKNQTSAVYVSDVSYAGIKGSYDTRSPPIHFGCSDAVPCTNITLTDVELLPAQGDAIADPFCWNVYGESQTLTIPPVSCLLQGLPRSIMDIDSDRCY